MHSHLTDLNVARVRRIENRSEALRNEHFYVMYHSRQSFISFRFERCPNNNINSLNYHRLACLALPCFVHVIYLFFVVVIALVRGHFEINDPSFCLKSSYGQMSQYYLID